MSTASRRFVILRHIGCEKPHWDFLLEQDQTLATWQLYHDPLAGGNELFQIEDHRKLYLDYEGQLEGDRGEVHRVCAGTYTLLEKNSQLWRVRLASAALTGEFELRWEEDRRWVLVKIGASS